VFSSIRTVLFKTLTGLIKCSKAVTSKEDSALLTIINSVFHFINLCKEDISVICDFKR